MFFIKFSSPTNNFLKSFIFVSFLSIEGYAQVALQNELIKDLFVQHFKTITLGVALLRHFSITVETIFMKIEFLKIEIGVLQMELIFMLHGKCPNMSPHSVRMREKVDQKKLRLWTLFAQ